MNNIKFLNGVKYGGYVLGIFGTAISALQFAGTNDPSLRFEYGSDIFMGGIGFVGLPGAATSGLYFLTKPLQENWRENVLIPQMETGISGYPSVQPFK